jgi:uncharacterized protein
VAKTKGLWVQYFALIYTVVDDYVERRSEFRADHLQLAQAAASRGELVLAGAFADPVDRALLIFRAPDREAVEDFVRVDPYVTNGLVTSWEIRPWTVVIGGDAGDA